MQGKSVVWNKINKLNGEVRNAIIVLNEYGLMSDKESEDIIQRAVNHQRATKERF